MADFTGIHFPAASATCKQTSGFVPDYLTAEQTTQIRNRYCLNSVLIKKLMSWYKIEIGPDNTKVMINNPNCFQREIKIKSQRLEAVENFKYLGLVISDEGP